MLEAVLLRFLASFSTGVILTGSGSMSQSLSRNPLASPSTLGIQAIAFLFQIASFFIFGEIYIFQSLIAFHVLFFGLLFWTRNSDFKFLNNNDGFFKNIIIVGLCLNLCVAGLYSLLQFVMLNSQTQFPSQLWFGHFKFVSYPEVITSVLCLIVFFTQSLKFSKKLRLFCLGRDFALGIDRSVLDSEKNSFFLIFYSVSVMTILFGVFSFVGLVFPHIFRRFKWFKNDLYLEVLIGSILGGVILASLDTLSFLFPVSGSELSVGMLTSVLGPLGLVIILLKNNK